MKPAVGILRRALPPTFACMCLAILGLSLTGARAGSIINVLAYNCGGAQYQGQQDVFNGTRHGWLGYCNSWS